MFSAIVPRPSEKVEWTCMSSAISGPDPLALAGGSSAPAIRPTSSGAMKSSSIIRTMPVGRNSIRPGGIGSPSASFTHSFGMSTPLATVSGIVPGKRGLTSSRAGSPVSAPLTWTFATPVRPIVSATLRPNSSSASSRLVTPQIAIPESTRMRSRGTTATTSPSARARTSSEYSGPGRFSWTSSVPSRGRRSRSARVSISMIPREPLPVRGFTKAGSGVLGRVP